MQNQMEYCSAQFKHEEVKALAEEMDLIMEDFILTASRLEGLNQKDGEIALMNMGWPRTVYPTYARFNGGRMTRSQLAAHVAKAAVLHNRGGEADL